MTLTPWERVIKICDELPFDHEMREAIKESYLKRDDEELEEFVRRYQGAQDRLEDLLGMLDEKTKKS